MQLGVERVELRLDRGLAFAQLGGAGAELVERDELLLVAVQQSSDRVLGADEVALERVSSAGGGVRRAHRLESAVDFGLDQRGVFEQREHAGPDELVDLRQPDRSVLADASFGAAVAVGARAAVVLAKLPVLAAGRAAVVRVPALATDEDPLQQRRATGVARREAAVAVQTLLRERELLLADERGDRDPFPVLRRDLLAGDVGGALPSQPRLTGGADGLAGRARLAVGGLPGVGRVAEHPPDRGVVPARGAGSGRHALRGEPPSDLRDRLVLLEVAAEDLAHDRRLGLVDLEECVGVLGALDVPVAVRGAGHDRDRAASGAVKLAAAAALSDLGPLVLGDHPLELAQELILRGAGPLGLLGEDHLDPGALELLQQQHLIGVPAREPIRRMTQQHLEAALDRQITQALQPRAAQHRARDALVLEHQILDNEQVARGGELTQRSGLAADRLLATLPVRGHPRVDRSHSSGPLPRHPHAVAAVVHCRSPRSGSHDAAPAPRSRTPAPAARQRGGQTRTRSQRAGPPGSSPA